MRNNNKKKQNKMSGFLKNLPKALAVLSALLIMQTPLTASDRSAIPSVDDIINESDRGEFVAPTPFEVNAYVIDGAKGTLKKELDVSDIPYCNIPGEIGVTCEITDAVDLEALILCEGGGLNGGWSAKFIDSSNAEIPSPKCWNELEYCKNGTCLIISEATTPELMPTASISYETLSPIGGGTSYSQCPQNDTGAGKEYCIWEYDLTKVNLAAKGSDGTETTPSSLGITGNTGDDMFKIERNSHGFFEYVDLDESSEYRLKYIHRDSSGDHRPMMMPSGPRKSSSNEFKDYEGFVDKEPGGIRIMDACYPARAQIECNIPMIDLGGECGSANTAAKGTYKAQEDIPAEALCATGNTVENLMTVAGKISWVCRGTDNSIEECQHDPDLIAQCGDRDRASTYNTLTKLLDGGNEPGELCAEGSVLKGSINETEYVLEWRCTPEGNPAGAEEALCLINRQNCTADFQNMVIVQDLSASFADDMDNTINTIDLLLSHSFMSTWQIGLASTYGADNTPQVYKKELDWTEVTPDKDTIMAELETYRAIVQVPGSEDPIYAVQRAITDFAPGIPSGEGGIVVMITDEADQNREALMPAIRDALRANDMKLLILHTEPVTREHCSSPAGPNACYVPYTTRNMPNYYEDLIIANNMGDVAATEIITTNSSNLASAILSGLISLGCEGDSMDGFCNTEITNAPYGTYSHINDVPEGDLCKPGNVISASKVNLDDRFQWICQGFNGGQNSNICEYIKYAPTNGQCGIAPDEPAGTYQNFGAIPTDDLCGSGSTLDNNTPIVDNASTISWTCEGTYGGADSPTCSISKNYNATCGASNGNQFNDLAALQANNALCGTNASLVGNITENGGGWTWSCAPDYGLGNNASCAATKMTCPDGTVLPQGVVPDDQTCPPTPECFLQVSGIFIGGEREDILTASGEWFEREWDAFDEIGTAEVGTWTNYGTSSPSPIVAQYSNLVGPGEYPASSPHTGYSGTGDFRASNINSYSAAEYPFLHADSYTFDGIAVGPNTRVTIYSDRNFQGSIVANIQGPKLINNGELAGSTAWLTEAFPEPYQTMFPPSSRQYSVENIQPWGRGTSVKVECLPPPPACGDLSVANGDYYFAHQQIPEDKFCESGTPVLKQNKTYTVEWTCRNGSDTTTQQACTYTVPDAGICGGFDVTAISQPCTPEWVAHMNAMGLFADASSRCANPDQVDPVALAEISTNPTDTDLYCNIGVLRDGDPKYGVSSVSKPDINGNSMGIDHRFRYAQWKCNATEDLSYGWTCTFDTGQYLARCNDTTADWTIVGDTYFHDGNARCVIGSVQNIVKNASGIRWECHSGNPDAPFYQNCGVNAAVPNPAEVGTCNMSLSGGLTNVDPLTMNSTSRSWCTQGTVTNFVTTSDRIEHICQGSNPLYKANCNYDFDTSEGAMMCNTGLTIMYSELPSLTANNKPWCKTGSTINNFSKTANNITFQCINDDEPSQVSQCAYNW
jgi:hypothetical protein